MTKEQLLISNKNRDALRKKLGLHGYEYVLHHVDVTMRHQNIERYIQWNEEDVIVMTRSEHTKLHYNEIFTEEARYKCGWKRKFPNKKKLHIPKEHSDIEWRTKISEATKGRKGSSTGKHWYNNGIIETYDFECPEGFTKGRLKGALDKANNARLKRYAEQSRIESD